MARANVDLPAPDGPITPTALPGLMSKLTARGDACCCLGGITVTACDSNLARGCGRGVFCGSGGISPNKVASESHPLRARCTNPHCPMANSIGANARPNQALRIAGRRAVFWSGWSSPRRYPRILVDRPRRLIAVGFNG